MKIKWPIFIELLAIILLLVLSYIFYQKDFFADTLKLPKITGLEDDDNWTKEIKTGYYKYAQNATNVDFVSNNASMAIMQDTQRGDIIKIDSKSNRVIYSAWHPLSLTPGKKYRLTFWMKIANRTCYQVPPSSDPGTIIEPIGKSGKNVPDIFCGRYDAVLKSSPETDPHDDFTRISSLLPLQLYENNSVVYKDRDWFQIKSEFTAQADKMYLFFRSYGMLGQIYIDGINLDPIDSYLEPTDLEMPVNYSKEKIISFNNAEVQTTSAIVKRTVNRIYFYHRNDPSKLLASIYPGVDNFFSGMKINPVSSSEKGYVIWENSNIVLGINADSTIILKLKKEASLGVSSVPNNYKPDYSFFKQGILFVRRAQDDNLTSGEGLQFMPVLNTIDYQDVYYNPSSLIKKWSTGEVNFSNGKWNVSESADKTNFDNNNWNVTYSGKSGDAYLVSVFPPKNLDNEEYMENYCTLRSRSLSSAFSNPAYNNSEQMKYLSLSESDRNNIVVLWLNNYSGLEKNEALYNYDPAKAETNFYSSRADLAGPYHPRSDNLIQLKEYINQMHSLGLKAVIYVGSSFWYSGNIDEMLANLSNNLKILGADGAYFDGYLRNGSGILQNLEFMRKARAILGNKILIQHQSGNEAFGLYNEDSYSLRFPALDAYADNIWVGEVSGIDINNDTWNNNFTGKGLSNSVSNLLMFDRKGYSIYDQIKLQLDNLGSMTFPVIDNPYEPKTRDTSDPIDWIDYSKKLNEKCLSTTCGNKTCDVGESVFTCPSDCTPQDDTKAAKKDSQLVSQSNKDTANWLIKDSSGFSYPLFDLHYNFSNNNLGLARDISGNKIDPSAINGYLAHFDENQKLVLDTKTPKFDKKNNSYYFDGSSMLFGYIGNRFQKVLDLSNKETSIFARIKKDFSDTDESNYTIFEYGNVFLRLLVDHNKVTVGIAKLGKDGSQQMIYKSSKSTLGNNKDWHTIGFTYDDPQLKIYIDGQLDSTYSISGARELGPNDQTFNIGGYGYRGSGSFANRNNFYGYIDDLFVSKHVLTDNQIKDFYNDPSLKTLSLMDSYNTVQALTTNNQNQYFISSE